MCIYLRNNPAKFRPDQVQNDGPLGYIKRRSSQDEEDIRREIQDCDKNETKLQIK